MFNPSVDDVRNFFYATYAKAQQNQALSDLEKIVYSIILEHPEYRQILENKDKYFDFKWNPAQGDTNPFLHMSMHISIIEQLSIDQPIGIKQLYIQLCEKFGSEHDAQHEVMDCLAEMIWQAQVNKSATMDSSIYLNCLHAKLNK